MNTPDRDDAARWREIARQLLGDATLTSAEVSARAEYPLEDTRRLWRAIGLPPVPEDERAFSESDVEILRGVQLLLSRPGANAETAVQVARVIGRSTAQIADAIVGVAAETAREVADAAEPPPGLAEVLAGLAPAIEPFLLHVWRHHLLASLLRGMAGSDAATDPVLAVGFVDLVGFTALAQRLETTTLTAVLDRFEALSYERIVEHGGRVVKLLGDEVMFVVDAPALAAEIALDLLDACAADPRVPDARAGVALGPVRSWEGDHFGPTVNLASRLVGVARPGTVLASEELGAALDPAAFVLRHLRRQPLQGIGRVRSWVVRRAAPRSA